VAQAQQYIAEGHGWCVDLDLEKFFDRVNHDQLMGQIAKRIEDQRLLKLIRAFLKAGVMFSRSKSGLLLDYWHPEVVVHQHFSAVQQLGDQNSRGTTLAIAVGNEAFRPTTGSWTEGDLIGIGAAVTRRPLPNHRAYGSVHGGSIGYASPRRPRREGRAT